MKKTNLFRSVLSFILAATMVVSVPMTVFAETVTETETTANDDGTTTVLTTTTTTTESNGKTTVTVKIEEATDGTTTDGVTVDRDVTSTEKTTTWAGTVLASSVTEKGTETKEWTEEDTGDEPGQPEVEVELKPGETTTNASDPTTTTTGDKPSYPGDQNYDYTETTTTDRTVEVETSDIEVEATVVDSSVVGIQPELKFDRNDTNDQAEKKKETELYTDNGHFSDTTKITVENTPENYPYELVGDGDYSGHYVSKIRVIYKRDEADNPIKDADGNYVIDRLEHSNGTVLTKNGVPTTDLNGPFDQTTGTRPQQFLLMNENGDAVYGYCIDLGTPTSDGKYYQVGNLEDNDYYATDDAEKHVRTIVTNGYWGTASGTGSLSKIKEDMKKALADGVIEKEYDITFVNREKNNGRALKEGEYIAGDYICWQLTEHVVLTEELIDSFTEGEAMDATQSAIWSYANGSNATLDGTDRMIVGDINYASSKLGDTLNGKNDFAGAARTQAFYHYLMNLQTEEKSTIVINEKNFVEDLTMTVGDKSANNAKNQDSDKNNDVYDVSMNFTLAFVPDKDNDDLLVYLMDENDQPIKDKDGNPIIRRLAGKNSEGREHDTILPDANGVYTLEGLQLSENEDFAFDLRLEGTQYLEQGVYIYTAEGGANAAQTLVGMGEGTNTVDVSVGVTIKFAVDENNKVVATRKWSKGNDPQRKFTTRKTGGDETVIDDEEVPLADAPETGDASLIYGVMSAISGMGLAALNLTGNGKKKARR